MMQKIAKALLLTCLLALTMGGNALAQNGRDFIDGFPDVPFMDIIERIDGEPMVFDTASGTVAEATVFFAVAANQAIEAYQAALIGLGWACEQKHNELSCIRENTAVIFTIQSNAQSSSSFILRLEPRR